MAHFANIDEDNLVIEVLVVPDDQEHRGQDFLSNDLGLGGNWIQTSYNGNIRANFAGVGYTYDPVNDVFIPPKPFPSWILNDDWFWEAPIERPGNNYLWNEENVEWVEIT
jgi:hypothetical protein